MPDRAIKHFLLPLLPLLPLLLSGSAQALDPQRSLAQMNHAAWTERDGAPSDVFALAQSGDGFLWLGTPAGLVRFDGASFERYAPPAPDALLSPRIYSLMSDARGRIWIGYTFGGASVINEDGSLTHFRVDQGFPAGTVKKMLQAPDGAIWVLTNNALARHDGKRWVVVPTGAQPLVGMAFDRRGTIWLASLSGVFFIRPGATAPERFDIAVKPDDMAVKVWAGKTLRIADASGLREYALTDDYAVRPLLARPLPLHGDFFLEDRAGSIMVSIAKGVGRVSAPELARAATGAAPRIEQMLGREGLSGQSVESLLEDREGNVWLGTNGGLDRIRDNRFRMLEGDYLNGGQFGVEASVAGQLWVSASDFSLRRLGVDPRTFAELGPNVTAIANAGNGTLDIGSLNGLWHFDGQRMTRLPEPPVKVGELNAPQALLRDRQGRLWFSQSAASLYRLDGQTWVEAGHEAGMYPGRAIVLHLAPDGAIWFGYPGNRVARRDDDQVRRFGAGDGLAVGNVMALRADGPRLWVGGELGVALFDGARFHALRTDVGGAFNGASGLVFSSDGALWINGAAGIARVPPQQLRQFLADPRLPVQFERFDHHDGADGTVGQLRPLPTAHLGADGRLWFVTSRKVISIDPLNIARNPLPPAVRIGPVHAGGVTYAPVVAGGVLQLPQLTRALDINYTALSLSVPDRVRFRYRLGGVDQQWQDAGNRRTAYYTNLAPGSYRFELLAANEDGVWNPQVASMDFSIAPAYYQTVWFRILLAGAGLLAVWAMVAARNKMVAARQQGKLAERERIARELHDTLLQSTQGLIFGFHAAVQGVPDSLPARGAMETILDRAELALKEARDGVHDLRAARRQSAGIDQQTLLEKIFAGLPPEARGAVDIRDIRGQPRPLRAAIADEGVAIVREALLNAMRHSGAANLGLVLDYQRRQFVIIVRDDGIGLPPAVLANGSRSGHWGLIGMRERTAKLGARLAIDSEAGLGTSVTLRMPAASAYAQRGGWLRRLFRYQS